MLYEEKRDDIQMALTGDSLITRRMSVFREKRFLEMAAKIMSRRIN